VREVLLALFKLQQIDSRAQEFEQAALKLPERIHELEGVLDKQRVALGAMRNEEDAKRKEQEAAEAQIREEGEKIQKWKRRLQEIRTPREYQALSREVEQLERLSKELEDKVLLLQEEREAIDKAAAEKETELREAEAVAFKEIRELREAQAKLNREATEAKAGREALVASLSKRWVSLYERTRAARDGLAVVPTAGDSCSGCNRVLRPQLMVELRKLDTVHTCPYCSRVVVLDSLTRSENNVEISAST
jgi:predicted  nucleic acid-binding Zn-ribbon protein